MTTSEPQLIVPDPDECRRNAVEELYRPARHPEWANAHALRAIAWMMLADNQLEKATFLLQKDDVP